MSGGALDPRLLEEAVDLQGRSYRLLRWVDRALQGGALRFDVAHGALTTAEAAEEWIGRHLQSLPPDARPASGELPRFARFFASYLTTSFELDPAPGMRLGGPHCPCPICSYLVRADHLKPRKLGRHAEEAARSLERLFLGELLPRLGAEAVDRALADAESDADLARDLALATYGRELLRRAEFSSQGAGVLALWRTFAWERSTDPRRPYWRPREGFALTAAAILAAQEALLERFGPG